MKYNTNFGKLKSETEIEFGPIPLIVVTHHHEEWDEHVINTSTEEPVEETQHKIRDWNTYERKIFPKAIDYLQMEYLFIIRNLPSEPAPDGYHYEESSYELSQDGESIICHYQIVENPIDDQPLIGVIVPSSPNQNELTDVVKTIVTTFGGEIKDRN